MGVAVDIDHAKFLAQSTPTDRQHPSMSNENGQKAPWKEPGNPGPGASEAGEAGKQRQPRQQVAVKDCTK